MKKYLVWLQGKNGRHSLLIMHLFDPTGSLTVGMLTLPVVGETDSCF